MKIGFIGYGRHVRANIYPLLRELGVRISAVCTTHVESAQQTSSDYQITKMYTNHIEMLMKLNTLLII